MRKLRLTDLAHTVDMALVIEPGHSVEEVILEQIVTARTHHCSNLLCNRLSTTTKNQNFKVNLVTKFLLPIQLGLFLSTN